jgi:hypothetical protein
VTPGGGCSDRVKSKAREGFFWVSASSIPEYSLWTWLLSVLDDVGYSMAWTGQDRMRRGFQGFTFSCF